VPDDTLAQDNAEKRRRDFERSLAGPSVGKAGLMRDQTGELSINPTDKQRSTVSLQTHPR
jgi:hypothetical protein